MVADFGVVKSTLARKHILGGMGKPAHRCQIEVAPTKIGSSTDQTTFAFVEFTRHDTVQKVIDIFVSNPKERLRIFDMS